MTVIIAVMRAILYTVVLGMSYTKTVMLLVAALSLSICIYAQQVVHVKLDGADKEIMVFPRGYKPDSTFKYLDDASTKKPAKDAPADFDTQLADLAIMGITKGGNAIVLNKIEDPKQTNHYRFWGDIYNTSNYNTLKSKATDKKQKRSKEPWALVTIYRPAYTGGFNDDSITYDILVNDTLKLPMNASQQLVLRVVTEGKVRLTVKHKDFVQNLELDVLHGKNYYVRNYTNFPGSGKYVKAGDMKVRVRGYSPYLDIVSEQQGVIESSMLRGLMIVKRVE